MVRPLTAESEPPLFPEANGGQRNRRQLFELNAGTQNRVASWAPDQDGASNARAAAAVAVDAAGDTLAEMTGDERRAILAEALDGMTTMERAETGDPELMDEVLDSIANMSKGPEAEGFVKPRVVIASHGDPLELADSEDPAGPKHVLDDDILGAYVPPDADGNPPGGTILLSNTLSSTPAEGELSLEDVALEELGEAVAEYAFSQGIRAADGPRSVVNDEGETVAAGDAGARILVARDGEALTDDHFVADPENDLTNVLLGNNLEENVAANGTLAVDPDFMMTVAEADLWLGRVLGIPVDGEGALDPSITFTGQELFDLFEAAGTDPLGVTRKQFYAMALLANPDTVTARPTDDLVSDAQWANVSFTVEDLRMLAQSNAIQFSGANYQSLESVHIDVSGVDQLVQLGPDAGGAEWGQTIGQYILNKFGTGETINQLQIKQAFQNLYGINGTQKSADPGSTTNMIQAFRAYAAENGVDLENNRASGYNEATHNLLDGFIWSDTESDLSLQIDRVDIKTANNYKFNVRGELATDGSVDILEGFIISTIGDAFSQSQGFGDEAYTAVSALKSPEDYANVVTTELNEGTNKLVTVMNTVATLGGYADDLREEMVDLHGPSGDAEAKYLEAESDIVGTFVNGQTAPPQVAGKPVETFEELISFLKTDIAIGLDNLTEYVKAAAEQVQGLADAEDEAGFWASFDMAQAAMLGASSLLFVASGGLTAAGAGSVLYAGASWMEIAQQAFDSGEDPLAAVAMDSGIDFQDIVNLEPDSGFSLSIYEFSQAYLDFQKVAIAGVDGAAEFIGTEILHKSGVPIEVTVQYDGSRNRWDQSQVYAGIHDDMQVIANDQNWQSNDLNEDPMLDEGREYFTYATKWDGSSFNYANTYDEDTNIGLRVVDPLVVTPGEVSNAAYVDQGEVGWWEFP